MGQRRFLGEGAAGVGFRYFSNSSALNLSGMRQYRSSTPGFEFRRYGGFAGVVFASRASFQIVEVDADVFMLGEINDFRDDVDVPHRCSHAWRSWSSVGCLPRPVFALRASPGTTLRPSGSGVAAPRVARRAKRGGARRDRTADLLHAMQALSQLSYGPVTYRAPWATRGHDPEPQFRADLKSLRRRRRRR